MKEPHIKRSSDPLWPRVMGCPPQGRRLSVARGNDRPAIEISIVAMLMAIVFLPAPAAAAEDLVAMTRRVLGEAEQLGLPSLAGCTIYEGHLTDPGEERPGRLVARSMRHLHARRGDGEWLIDLLHPIAASELDADEIAALKPFVPGSVYIPAPDELAIPPSDVVAQARRLAAGVPEALANFPPRAYWRLSAVFYPRKEEPEDPEEALRIGCRDCLLAQHLPEAAMAMVPERWRAASLRQLRTRTPPAPLPAGVAGAVASISLSAENAFQPADAALLPEVTDEALVNQVGDQTAAVNGSTIGENALNLLSGRWCIDPAVLAGRTAKEPWDDAEQAAVAKQLAIWWSATAGRTLAERWLVALAAMPLEKALSVIELHAGWMSSRRINAREAERERSSPGATLPAIPADDTPQLMDGLMEAVLAHWATMRDVPSDVTPSMLLAMLPHVASKRTFAEDMDLATKLQAQRRAEAINRTFRQRVQAWPRAGSLAMPLAIWDDMCGEPASLDALVERTLAQPEASAAQLQEVLRLWVFYGTVERWQRLRTISQGDPADRRFMALHAIAQEPYHIREGRPGTVVLVRVLGWHLLQDERPLAAEMVASQQEPADATVASSLAMKLGVRMPEFWPGRVGCATLERAQKAGATKAEIMAVREVIVRTFAEEAAEVLTQFKLPLPAGLAPPASAMDDHGSAGTAGLTGEEAGSIRAILQQAQELGFPDLTGAKVLAGRFPLNDTGWRGIHIQLANASWLAECVIPVAHADPGVQPDWLAPGDRELDIIEQLPAAARQRVAGGAKHAYLERGENAVLPALSWWLSGQDPDGRALVGAVYLEAVERRDLAVPWTIPDHRQAKERGALLVAPSIPDGVRRSLARWFRQRMVWAVDAAAAEQAAAAARALLPAGERTLWEPLLARMRARLELPASPAAGAELVARLQSWKDTSQTDTGQWMEGREVPATRTDTPALVALLADDRPTRWVSNHALPRPVGDAALLALGEIWGVDWRWLVVDEPAVAAVLTPSLDAQRATFGDEWLWSQTAWTDERRRVIVAALQAWWRDHGAAGESPSVAVLRVLPLSMWEETLPLLSDAEVSQPHFGDIVADRLRALPVTDHQKPENPEVVAGLLSAVVLQPKHAGISALLASWPTRPWIVALVEERAEFAGDAAQFDRWMQDAMEHHHPPEADYFRALYATPWGALGLWVHRPTATRLASLRQVLARDPKDPVMRWMLVEVGSGDWMLSRLAQRGEHELADGKKARAIPCALALAGLADRRPLARATRVSLESGAGSHWNVMGDLAKNLPADARVCDWVAVRMLLNGSVLDREPSELGTPQEYVAAPIGDRDGVIKGLVERLTPLAEETAVAAGLLPSRQAPPGVSDF